MSAKNRNGAPQKGARKLVIDDETWWFMIGANHTVIWSPTGEKRALKHGEIETDYDNPWNESLEMRTVLPFDVRRYINEKIRGVPDPIQKIRQGQLWQLKESGDVIGVITANPSVNDPDRTDAVDVMFNDSGPPFAVGAFHRTSRFATIRRLYLRRYYRLIEDV